MCQGDVRLHIAITLFDWHMEEFGDQKKTLSILILKVSFSKKLLKETHHIFGKLFWILETQQKFIKRTSNKNDMIWWGFFLVVENENPSTLAFITLLIESLPADTLRIFLMAADGGEHHDSKVIFFFSSFNSKSLCLQGCIVPIFPHKWGDLLMESWSLQRVCVCALENVKFEQPIYIFSSPFDIAIYYDKSTSIIWTYKWYNVLTI